MNYKDLQSNISRFERAILDYVDEYEIVTLGTLVFAVATSETYGTAYYLVELLVKKGFLVRKFDEFNREYRYELAR